MIKKTKDGRPSHIGSLYIEQCDNGSSRWKYCVGYCPSCRQKMGLNSDELKELYSATHYNPGRGVVKILRTLFKIRIKFFVPN